MADQDWHQLHRSENYEPLEPAEAEAVAAEATAILARPSSGRQAMADHRTQFTQIGDEIGIRGWDDQPPRAMDEIGGLTLNQLQPILSRAIRSGARYLTVTGEKPANPSASSKNTEPNAALDRLRKRIQERKERDS